MTQTEFNIIENNYNEALNKVRYLAVLYHSLLDILKGNFLEKGKYNKKVLMKKSYSHECHSKNEIVNYAAVELHFKEIDTFEIPVSNCLSSHPEIIKALPKGAGFTEDHWYKKEDIPQLLRNIKNLRKEADIQFSRAQNDYNWAWKERRKGLVNDPLADLRCALNSLYRGHFDVDGIKEYLKSKGVEI